MAATSASATVATLADRRARAEQAAQERVERALQAARDVACETFFAELGDPSHVHPEIRLLLAATVGDPDEEYTYTEARFAALRDRLPIDDADKRAMALGILKAVSEPLYSRLIEGVELLERVEALAEAAAAGDAEAESQLRALAPVLFAGA